MNDEFLIKFGMGTLIIVSFASQHFCQWLFYRISKTRPKDENAGYISVIIVAQLLSMGIIVELIKYAMSK